MGKSVFALREILSERVSNLQGEAFIYGREQNDSQRFQTLDRAYTTVGFRLFREAQAN